MKRVALQISCWITLGSIWTLLNAAWPSAGPNSRDVKYYRFNKFYFNWLICRCKVHCSDFFVQRIASRTFHLAVQLAIYRDTYLY
jgi:hypothetical protein